MLLPTISATGLVGPPVATTWRIHSIWKGKDMIRSRLLLALCGLSLGLFIAIQDLLSQDLFTIDASTQLSVPARGRGPFPGSNSPGHTINLPVRLGLSFPSTELHSDQTLLIDFVITNVRKEAVRLPSSVNPNLEPRTSLLTLWITSDAIKDQYLIDSTSGRLFKLGMVRTSAELYGSSDDPRTVIVLAPNKSVRVHTSSGMQLRPGSHAFTAHAELLHIIARNSSISSQLAGSADSEPVTMTLSTTDPAAR